MRAANIGRSLALGVAITTVVVVVTFVARGGPVTSPERPAPDSRLVPAGVPIPLLEEDYGDSDMTPYAVSPPGGVIVQPGTVRVPVPKVPTGPRKVGIQVGHWKVDEAPDELKRLAIQTGTTWRGINEVDVNLDIADRVAKNLRGRGIAVEIFPATVPAGYVADAFIALHADGDGTGENSGFKLAHSARRGPFEDRLLQTVREEYAKATQMDYDATHISRSMTGYFIYNWSRYQHAVSPYTPGTILEMGYLSNDDDRGLLVEQPDVIAKGIANGLLRFLNETPRDQIFGKELVVPQLPLRSPSPTAP